MVTEAPADAAHGLQEPPSADHLFADAHVDPGTGHDAGSGPDSGAVTYVDAPPTVPDEPPPVAPQEHNAGRG